MSMILEQRFERSLDALIARFSSANMRGKKLQVWLFEDGQSRKAAEEKLRQAGVEARFCSAYKPLVHFFLEEVACTQLASVAIRYPTHPNTVSNRFLLEAYPLGRLIGDASISFKAGTQADLTYEVDLHFKDGRQESHSIFAPNHVHRDAIGEVLLSPTGWLVLDDEINQRFETDYETLFQSGMAAIANQDWGHGEPYFEELNIRVTLPIRDLELAYDHEMISLREALHEDFYFSLLEVFQQKSGRPVGDRGLQPGQIVPEILYSDEAPSIRIETRSFDLHDETGPEQDLATAKQPLFSAQILSELQKLGGEAFSADSRSARTVHGTYVKGADFPVMISGGQHANETSGVVGALRAAQILRQREGAHFTLSPQENPDGYALHFRLRKDNPTHMHHAARYTALGDDLEYRTGEGLYEKAIRIKAEQLTKAGLHINLHGYPSHEWTRPLSAYIPRGFAMWTLPKGFFLIMRHHALWKRQAEQLIDDVTLHLSRIEGLVAFNDQQIALFEQHAGETGFSIINGFPCLIGMDDRHAAPLTLITEYPDETIYGEAFTKGHDAQMETVLSAYDAWQHLKSAQPTV